MHRSTLAPRAVAGVLAAGAVLVVSGSAPPAAATSPAFPPNPAVLGQRVNAHADGIRLAMPEGAVIRDLTEYYVPGQDSKWHEHPGVVLVAVEWGTVYRSLPCKAPEKFADGQAFLAVGPYRLQNLGTTANAKLSITQIAPPHTTADQFDVPLPAPDCRHPPR